MYVHSCGGLPSYNETGRHRAARQPATQGQNPLWIEIIVDVRVPSTNHSTVPNKYSVILSVLDPRKCEYLKDYSLDFEHAYMTAYLAS